jgi:hypothetical protein
MDIHHDTSFRSVLEDDSFLMLLEPTFAFVGAKGGAMVDYWAIYMYVPHRTLYFHINNNFCLSLIQPSKSSLFMCECGHGSNASGTHLTCCPFKGQQIATHNTIKDVMYALV